MKPNFLHPRMLVRELSQNERPREKMALRGPSVLSEAELIAILLRTGTRTQSSIEIAQRLLAKFSLIEVAKLSVDMIASYKGLGKAKACSLIAALELAKRMAAMEFHKEKIESMEDIGPRYQQLLGHESVESFYGVFLDTRQKIIREEKITSGTVNASLIHPREFFRAAILCGASAAIAIHNHPSGDPDPSDEDRVVSETLAKAGEMLGIPLLDHVVVGRGGYCSALEQEKKE